MTESDIISIIEDQYGHHPDEVCFYVASKDAGVNAEYENVTIGQLRSRSFHLAQALYEQGLERGMWCISNMGNCPEIIYLVVAAAIGGFKVALLNPHLSATERRIRIEEMQKIAGVGSLMVLHSQDVSQAIANDMKRNEIADDELSDLMKCASQALIRERDAFAVFASGPYGKPKVIVSTWANLLGAAKSVNITVSQEGEGLWQMAMPLHRVAGIQVLLRSLLNRNPFIMYGSYDVQRVLDDAVRFDTTHVSIWGSSLQDMLDLIPEDSPNEIAFRGYECIMLGGSSPSMEALHRAARMGARVYACFGMAETCGNVAACLVSERFDGRLYSLPGYQLAVIAPDESGYGQLAVKGPGIVPIESNPSLVFTADGFLLTGAMAMIDDPGVRLLSEADGHFVSKGEDINPQEIRQRLLQVPGVTDAYVFADESDEWGRRPVAVVEVRDVSRETGTNLQVLAQEIGISLANKLAPMLRPDRIIAVPGFPHHSDGQVDSTQLRLLFGQRIDIRKVEAYLAKIPLVTPMFVGNVKLKEQQVLIVRVTDWQGRTGIGECLALPSACHPKRSLEEASDLLKNELVPLVKSHVYIHPSQASVLIRSLDVAQEQPLACAALENAIWDLNGKIICAPMTQMIGARVALSKDEENAGVPIGFVSCGTVIKAKTEVEAVEKARALVRDGCRCVRLRVRPGHDTSFVEAIRREFPKLALVLDAGKTYNETNVAALCDMDFHGIACIVDPLDPSYVPKVGPQGIWERLVRLQRSMSVPICIDSTWSTREDLHRVICEYPEIRCVALRLGKMGGVQPALEFYWQAREKGLSLMFSSDEGTSISTRLQAAFCKLPGATVIGDFPIANRYSSGDLCEPGPLFESCCLELNPEGNPHGLGCHLDEEALSKFATLAWEA